MEQKVQAGRMMVLVVDPDHEQGRAISQILHPWFEVHWAGTVADAWQRLRQIRPSIVLLELDLPDDDGFRFLRELRAQEAWQPVVVCCVTHRRANADRVAAFQAGANDYVIKPVNPRLFRFRLKLLLRSVEQ